jgi:hypothetical protein
MRWLSWIFVYCVGLGVQFPASQEPTTPDQLPPSPKSVEVKLADNAGVRITYTFAKPHLVEAPGFMCHNDCNGEKHVAHAQCDSSCDTNCKDNHLVTAPALFQQNFGDTTKFDNSVKQFGLKEDRNFLHNQSLGALEELGDSHKFDHKFQWQHWCSSPCARSFRNPQYYVFDVVATLQLYRDTPDKDGKPIRTQGPKTDVRFLSVSIPTGKYTQSKEYVYCRCAVVEEDLKQDGGDANDKNGHGGKIIIEENGKEHVCTTNEVQKYAIVCVAQDMNECTWSAENPSDHPVDVCVYPGQELICTDPDYQDLCCTSATRLHLPAKKGSGPATLERVSGSGSVACTQMSKQMPSAKVGFKIGSGSSPELCRLAIFNSQESFRGPEGQIRMWIVTDKASLADIQQHMLFPKPTPAMYLRSLYAVGTVGGVDVALPEYRGCLTANLLAAVGVDAKTINWYVSQFPASVPSGLGSLGADDFADWWSEKGARYGDQSAADLANALCSSTNPKLRDFGVRFLSEFVPKDHRLAVAVKGGLSAVGMWLTRADAPGAAKSLDILEAYAAPTVQFFALNANPALPAELKARAAKLASTP